MWLLILPVMLLNTPAQVLLESFETLEACQAAVFQIKEEYPYKKVLCFDANNLEAGDTLLVPMTLGKE